MSDIMPKLRLYLLITFITLFVNIGVILTGWANNTETGIEDGLKLGTTQLTLSNDSSTSNPKTWWEVISWWVTGGFAGNNAGLLSLGTAFFPFVSILPLATLGIESNVFLIISLVLTVLGILQSLIIVFFGLQLISNLVYHPDV